MLILMSKIGREILHFLNMVRIGAILIMYMNEKPKLRELSFTELDSNEGAHRMIEM